jgi:hypothetical protein
MTAVARGWKPSYSPGFLALRSRLLVSNKLSSGDEHGPVLAGPGQEGRRLASFSLRSTGGSPKGSTRAI